MQRKNHSAVSPNMVRPNKRGLTGRAVTGIVLSLLLPPVGIFYLWRNGVFKLRGRVLVTALSGVICLLMFKALIPGTTVTMLQPSVHVPYYVTPAPEQNWSNALSSIEDVILAEYEASVTPTPTEDPEVVAQREAERKAKEEAVMNTIVYSVYNGAKYYHKQQKCGTQMNNKEQTVREALNNGLGACSLCNPPTP